MFDLVALVGALALIFVVLMLRGITALPFPRLRASFVHAMAPKGSASLFDEAFAQLAALGFESPRWVLVSRADGEAATQRLRAVLRASDGGLVWLAPPIAARNPHRLFVYYSHRLEDGRVAISQPFDTFFTSTQTEEIVARTAAELDFARQWSAHQRWIEGLNSDPRVADDGDILDAVTGLMERQRQTLISQGRLRAITVDVAVPKLRFALRLLRDYLRVPKPPIDPRPVPAERLALLAQVQEAVRHRAPPRRTQWMLFAISVAMFMLLGVVFWDVGVALGILVVVLIHELGHFLAMRAFGYRNVHVLALPLVGGVAMGVDANPAATRRAWMSLMGPLPGIVIGWVLLALVWSGGVPASSSGAVTALATMFLLINYLNVLPVPPLDGAHVMQSLLPPRFARVQTLLTGAAAAVGAWLAWQFGLVLLTLLALLHLAGLPASWRLLGIARELAADPGVVGMHRGARMLRLLQTLERHLGPATNAQQRINAAFELQNRVETKPMGTPARLATGTVFAGLLVVPVAALLFFGGWLQPEMESGGQHYAAVARERVALQASAQAMPLDDLVAGIVGKDTALLPPADDALVAATQARLGRPLPVDLRALYALGDGIPSVGLNGLESISTAANVIDTQLAEFSATLAIGVGEDDAYAYVEIPLADARHWWHLGGESDAPLFYLPVPDARLPGTTVVSYFLESPSVYASPRAWLEETWVSQEQARIATEARTRRTREAIVAWRDASLNTVLASFESPNLLLRLMADVPDWPDGADEATISATQARLAVRLPPDYEQFLREHDGFPPLQLLGSEGLARWHERRAQIPDHLRSMMFGQRAQFESQDYGEGVALPDLTEDAVSDCVLIGARHASDSGGELWPRLVWCPQASPSAQWIDLGLRRSYPQFRVWLVERAAEMLPAGEG